MLSDLHKHQSLISGDSGDQWAGTAHHGVGSARPSLSQLKRVMWPKLNSFPGFHPPPSVKSRYKGIKSQHFLQNGTPQKGHISSRVPLEMVEALVTTASQLNSPLLP